MESTDNSIRHIHEQRDGDAQFVIHPESNDVFVRTGKEVIASCELGISLEVYLGQLSDLFRAVASWGKSHPSVRAIFAYPNGSKIVLYVVPCTDTFNFDLADEMAHLNRDLVRDHGRVLGMIEVLQIPWQDRDSFVSDNARCIYGDRGNSTLNSGGKIAA